MMDVLGLKSSARYLPVSRGAGDLGLGAGEKGSAAQVPLPSFRRKPESRFSRLDYENRPGFRPSGQPAAVLNPLPADLVRLRRNDEEKHKARHNLCRSDRSGREPPSPQPPVPSPTPRTARGFATYSLLELIIVIILIAILFIVALENLLPMRGAAEEAHVQQTLGALRSAVSLRTVELIAQGGLNSVGQLHHSNPMAQLKITPGNYRGEKATINPAQLPPGSWVFETSSNTLLYKIRYPQYLAIDGPPIIRWQVQVNRNPSGSINGVAVIALTDYAWIEPEDSETLRLLGMK
ncbi:MAG TPA: hypothetical protein VFP95_01600 [Gammaproteobacteria bacterium]|nr:hypothetical protein [Gammaproteobacteria bacterium]